MKKEDYYHLRVALRLGWLTVLSSMKMVEQELAFCSGLGAPGEPR